MRMLTDDAKRHLLHEARRAVEARLGVSGQPLPAPPPAATEKRGAFVTLHTGAELRGCIGTFSFGAALCDAVRKMACAAAFEDQRFPPLAADELSAVRFEISALTVPAPIAAAAVEVGRHGLLIGRGSFRGVLLPQVPVEQGWDRDTFLRQTCRKAGLPDDAWTLPDTQLDAFEAEVFGEE